ncbi:hypothetical protein [Nocardiopsis deserti]|uniref:hypothetical protein n=1 Tax=Nocardiopsis deserti TaxID=2605988 RepID=UPI00123A6E30|nr:hypothetical protein [Nocardiopsis deserti]
MQTTRVLSWDDIKDTAGSPSDLHADFAEGLVYNVSAYYKAMQSGDADRFDVAAEMLRREEVNYWATFEMNPRHIIDPQDPAVIAAHAHLIAPIVFNPEADAVAANFARTVDLDNDHIHRPGRCRHAIAPAPETDPMPAYRSAYPSGPTSDVELAYLRRALSVWVITS